MRPIVHDHMISDEIQGFSHNLKIAHGLFRSMTLALEVKQASPVKCKPSRQVHGTATHPESGTGLNSAWKMI
jgi:hypothetical protein